MHGKADTTGNGFTPLMPSISRDSILNNKVMNSYQQAICKSIKIFQDSNIQKAWLFAALS